MMVLGLLMILAAVLLGADFILENTQRSSGTIFNQTVDNWSLGGVFLAGGVTALVLALGLWLALGGAARKRRKKVTRKSRMRETQTQKESLVEENTRLAQQLEQERNAKAAAVVSPYDDDSDSGSSRVR